MKDSIVRELRAVPRYSVCLPVCVTRLTGSTPNPSFNAFTRDISTRGMFVLSDVEPAAGELLEFEIDLALDEETPLVLVRGEGRVIRAERSGEQPAGFAVHNVWFRLCEADQGQAIPLDLQTLAAAAIGASVGSARVSRHRGLIYRSTSSKSGLFPGRIAMKKLVAFLLAASFLLPQITHAQSILPGQPAKADPSPSVDAATRQLLSGGETIRRGMVWRADGQRNLWVQTEANSCEFCGKPMSWKRAAFDKKALPLWLIAAGLSVADTEYTLSRPCIKDGTCTEWNPLLGTSRAQQYGVRMPALALAWLAGPGCAKVTSRRASAACATGTRSR